MSDLTITAIGNSLGVILPKTILEKLRVSVGDKLYSVETPNGIELTPYNPEFTKQMEITEDIMREDHDVLKKLAE